ncbi:MAG: cysteine--tRNA ligase [Candidatus Dojkabacteria bacterium]|jgi:cysteinyl-tRNA synthetase
MKLYSTLDKKIVEIEPNEEGVISMYNCGPTVYYRMHLGNIRAYVNWDILHRALLYLGYKVNRVMNITDVGHMTSQDDFGDDFGEDKMDRQAEKEGVEPIDIANKYINSVLDDYRALHILAPNGEEIPEDLNHENVSEYGWTRATEYIQEMIEIIKRMEERGYTYETDQAIYFDVTKVPDYTIFTGQKLEEKDVGVREEVGVDPDKRNPADFVLWMKKVGKYEDHLMNWSSPWGDGFPGWHIECSAMGTAILGENFDIHTGGIDHIPVHHANERAQNIGAFGHPVVKYWVHNEWLVNKDNEKLSKSKGADTLPEVLELGYDPMDVRYLFISVGYRVKMNFSLEALDGARNSRLALEKKVVELGTKKGKVLPEYVEAFKKELRNNLNISGVLALVNEMIKSDNKQEDILATVLDFDKVLGLGLDDIKKEEGYSEGDSAKLDELLEKRLKAKQEKDYELADKVRDEIKEMGYVVSDTPDGQIVSKI